LDPDLVFMEIHDELNRPAWKNALFPWRLAVLQEPEVINEFAERMLRNVRKKHIPSIKGYPNWGRRL
jgi:hypothetical protein